MLPLIINHILILCGLFFSRNTLSALIFLSFFYIDYVLVPQFYYLDPLNINWRFLANLTFYSDNNLAYNYIITSILFSFIIGLLIGERLVVKTVSFKIDINEISLRAIVIALLASFIVYFEKLGGITNAIIFAKELRSQRIHLGYVQYLIYFLDISLLIFCVIFFKWKRNFLILLFFAVLFAYTVTTAGRANIMIFLLVTLVCVRISGRLNPRLFYVVSIFTMLFCVFFVMYGKQILWSLPSLQFGFEQFTVDVKSRVKNESFTIIDNIIAFLRNFDHKWYSIHIFFSEKNIFEFPRLGLDWPRAFLDALPGFNQPEFIVTKTTAAHFRDFNDVDGYVPIGAITTSLANYGFLLSVPTAIFTGLSFQWIEKWAKSVSTYHSRGIFIYMSYMAANLNLFGDPFMLIIVNILPIIVIVLLINRIKI